MPRSNGFTLPSTQGRLLLAAPPLSDPNFDRAVIFMLEHNEGGALGLVLNRPSKDLDIEFEAWNNFVAPPRELFCGGPVEPQALIGLGLIAAHTPDGQIIVSTDCIAPVDLDIDPLSLDPQPQYLRIFHGYSGWGAQQLDGELEIGAWIVLTPSVADVFTSAPQDLWTTILRRQKGEVSWLADCPPDPTTN